MSCRDLTTCQPTEQPVTCSDSYKTCPNEYFNSVWYGNILSPKALFGVDSATVTHFYTTITLCRNLFTSHLLPAGVQISNQHILHIPDVCMEHLFGMARVERSLVKINDADYSATLTNTLHTDTKYSLLMHCIKIKSSAKFLLNKQYFCGWKYFFSLCAIM